MATADQQAAAAHAEENDSDQRQAEAPGARRGCRDRERQERDRVDDAERDDRERDRLEPELHAAELAQRADLDQVVEPEGEHGSARGSGAAGGQATRATRTAGRRKELQPPERAEDEAREVERDRTGDKPHVRALQRPARVREASSEKY